MKTVLITGANQGIGFETARQLAQLGYFVYLGSRSKNKGHEAAVKLKNLGISNIAWVELDVTHINSIIEARRQVESQTDVLDVLINNAGIAGTQPQNIVTGEMENLRQVFDTNFFGVVQTTQQFIPLLKKSNHPVIANISSELGSLTLHHETPNPNFSLYDAYSCSKTALNAFTVMLANALRDQGFKVNSITPGYTATQLNQYQGLQTPEQGASAIVKYVTLNGEGLSGKFFNQQGEVPW
jgi:NAD(P)-dependent dehydrogenase (short-subunit alcohol dehydrogenase family)